MVDQYSKENMLLQERLENVDSSKHNVKIDLENMTSELDYFKNQNADLRGQVEDEKLKNKNLVSLIKELEKKKSNSKVESECSLLKEKVEYLNGKLSEVEGKYKMKLEKKDLIIKKLDESLSEYEEKLNSITSHR